MKTLVLSMISIAATVAAMTACTSEGDPVDEVTKDAPVEIKLDAGINMVTPKSAGIQNSENHNFKANIIASNTSNTYASSIWPESNSGEITVNNGIVSFTKKQTYPSNGNTIYMKAYAPEDGTFTNDVVSFEIDGNKDIMVSQEIFGSKEDNSGKKLKFAHLLSQLNFTVQATNAEAQAAWGNITAIKIEAVKDIELTLSTGDLAAKSGSTASEIATSSFSTITKLPLANETASSGGYAMVLPQETAYKIIVYAQNGPTSGREITLSTPVKTEKSTAYNILLTFSATEVAVSAEVGAWTTSPETGAGTVN